MATSLTGPRCPRISCVVSSHHPDWHLTRPRCYSRMSIYYDSYDQHHHHHHLNHGPLLEPRVAGGVPVNPVVEDEGKALALRVGKPGDLVPAEDRHSETPQRILPAKAGYNTTQPGLPNPSNDSAWHTKTNVNPPAVSSLLEVSYGAVEEAGDTGPVPLGDDRRRGLDPPLQPVPRHLTNPGVTSAPKAGCSTIIGTIGTAALEPPGGRHKSTRNRPMEHKLILKSQTLRAVNGTLDEYVSL
jgi:hypothetical protein